MTGRKKNYVAIRRKSTFFNDQEITAYHSRLFHGYARRTGDPANLDETGQSPLEYIYNLAADTWVTQPRLNLLVRQEVLAEIPALSLIKTVPVQISKCVLVPFAKGDMSFFDRPPEELAEIGGDYHLLLTEAAPCGQISEDIRFAELCLPIISEETRGETINVEFPEAGLLEVDVVRPELEQPDFFCCEAGNVFETSQFGRLLEWIDTNYFEVEHLEL